MLPPPPKTSSSVRTVEQACTRCRGTGRSTVRCDRAMSRHLLHLPDLLLLHLLDLPLLPQLLRHRAGHRTRSAEERRPSRRLGLAWNRAGSAAQTRGTSRGRLTSGRFDIYGILNFDFCAGNVVDIFFRNFYRCLRATQKGQSSPQPPSGSTSPALCRSSTSSTRRRASSQT